MPAWTQIAKYSAFGLMALVALLGTAYVNGEILADPGGTNGSVRRSLSPS